MKDRPASIGVTCDQHVKSPVVVGFRNGRYKPIATQITYDAGVGTDTIYLPKILPPLGIKSEPHPIAGVQSTQTRDLRAGTRKSLVKKKPLNRQYVNKKQKVR